MMDQKCASSILYKTNSRNEICLFIYKKNIFQKYFCIFLCQIIPWFDVYAMLLHGLQQVATAKSCPYFAMFEQSTISLKSQGLLTFFLFYVTWPWS